MELVTCGKLHVQFAPFKHCARIWNFRLSHEALYCAEINECKTNSTIMLYRKLQQWAFSRFRNSTWQLAYVFCCIFWCLNAQCFVVFICCYVWCMSHCLMPNRTASESNVVIQTPKNYSCSSTEPLPLHLPFFHCFFIASELRFLPALLPALLAGGLQCCCWPHPLDHLTLHAVSLILVLRPNLHST